MKIFPISLFFAMAALAVSPVGHAAITATIPKGSNLYLATPAQIAASTKAAIAANPSQSKSIAVNAIRNVQVLSAKGITLQSPSGGSIAKVLVKKGEKVKAGQVIAMVLVDGKLEPLVAPVEGVITSFNLQEGMQVGPGTDIFSLAKSPSEVQASLQAAIAAVAETLPVAQLSAVLAAVVKTFPQLSQIIVATVATVAPNSAAAASTAVSQSSSADGLNSAPSVTTTVNQNPTSITPEATPQSSATPQQLKLPVSPSA